jgi:hypothetical protein
LLELWDLGLEEVELSYVLLERTTGDASTFASSGTGIRSLAVFTRQGSDGDVNVVGSLYDHP